MPVELIYDSTDEVNLANGSHYFSGFFQLLIAVQSSRIFVGAFLHTTIILEFLIEDSWQGFKVFQAKYPIVETSQNIWLKSEVPYTQAPDSRNKLLVKLSEPSVSSVKAYVF